ANSTADKPDSLLAGRLRVIDPTVLVERHMVNGGHREGCVMTGSRGCRCREHQRECCRGKQHEGLVGHRGPPFGRFERRSGHRVTTARLNSPPDTWLRAKFFAPGHRQTMPGGAKTFALGHRMR